MATKINYQQEVQVSPGFDPGVYASTGAAMGQAALASKKADADLLTTAGNMAVNAVVGYEQAELAKKLRAETDTLFKPVEEVVVARDELAVAQVTLKGLEAGKGTVFDADQAQQLTAAEKDVLDKRKRLEAAIEQGKVSPEKALRNMAVELRTAIAKWPGLADRFRKIASEMTGVDNLETYELRQLYAADKAQREAAAAAEKQRRQSAEKEAAALLPLIAEATKGKASLENVVDLVLKDDPSIAPFRATWAAREQADANLKFIKNNSAAAAEMGSDAPIANYTLATVKAGNEIAAVFLARAQNDPAVKAALMPNGALNPQVFSKLLAAGDQHAIQMQTTFRAAVETSYREARVQLEALKLGATDKEAARARLDNAHARTLKMMESADGMAQVYNTLITSATKGHEAQARTLSMLNNAAQMMGITPEFWKMRYSDPVGFAGAYKDMDRVMGVMTNVSHGLVNLVGETNSILGHIESTGTAPVLSKPLTKEQAEFIKKMSVEGRRQVFNRAATDPTWAQANPNQVFGAMNFLLEGATGGSIDPSSQKFTDFLNDISSPVTHQVLKNLPAPERDAFTSRVTEQLTKVGKAKVDSITEMSNVVPKAVWTTPDGRQETREWFKPVLKMSPTGQVSIKWEMINSPPVSSGKPDPNKPRSRLAFTSPLPFVKEGDEWVPNPAGIADAGLSMYVRTVTRTAAEINKLAVAASNTADLGKNTATEWLLSVLKNEKATPTGTSAAEKAMAGKVGSIDTSAPAGVFQDAVQGLLKDLESGKLSPQQQKELLKMLGDLGYVQPK